MPFQGARNMTHFNFNGKNRGKEMKILISSLLLFLFAGCTAYQSEKLIPGTVELDFYASTGAHRGMYDPHTYVSIYDPNLKISVDPSFRFFPNRGFGKLRYQFLGDNSDIYIHYYPNSRSESHQPEYPEPLEKLLWSRLDEKKVVDKGVEKLGGYDWEYRIWLSSDEDGCLLTKDSALSTLNQDILFVRYVEIRNDIVCEQVTNRQLAVAIQDWAHALGMDFNKHLNFDRIDLTTFGLGLHPEVDEEIPRLNDDSLIREIEYTNNR
jgi:hypothetical protein